MGFIKSIIKNNNENNFPKEEIKEPVMKYVNNETVSFDSNNIMKSISAGDAKATNDSTKKTNNAIDDINNKNVNNYTTYLDFEYVNDEKLKKYIEKNRDLINEYSNKWGISPNLIAAIYCQETSAGTNTNKDNEMQIDFNVHNNQEYEVYNFKDNKYEKIIITNDEGKYKEKGYITINANDLNNTLTAFSVAAIKLASNAKTFNYHVGSTIQSYNFGEKRTKEAINLEGDFNYITSNQDDLKFMRYTDNVSVAKNSEGKVIYNDDGSLKKVGDSNYLNNVMKYIKVFDDNPTITLKKYNNGIIEEINVNILPNNMK